MYLATEQMGYFAMNLFGTEEYDDLETSKKEQQKHKPSLLEMAEKEFLGDEALIEEIKKYLLSRKASRNYPTRVSWEMQLKLLKDIPKHQRVQSVRRSILNGYRQIAYEQKNVDALNLKKADLSKVSNISF